MKNRFIRSRSLLSVITLSLLVLSGCSKQKEEQVPEPIDTVVSEIGAVELVTDDVCVVMPMSVGSVSAIFDNSGVDLSDNKSTKVQFGNFIVEVSTGSYHDDWWDNPMFKDTELSSYKFVESTEYDEYYYTIDNDHNIVMRPTKIESDSGSYLFPYSTGCFKYSDTECVYVKTYMNGWDNLTTSFVDPETLNRLTRNMIHEVETQFCLAIGDYSATCQGSFSEETDTEINLEDFRSY